MAWFFDNGGQDTYSINAAPYQLGQQMSPNAKIEGLQVDSSESSAITLGLGIVNAIGKDKVGRLPRYNKNSVVFSADLVASNVINISVNGNAMAAVTYAVSHANTMFLILAQLLLVSGVETATLDATDTDNRTILVTVTDGLDCAITGAVTLGGSQATITATKLTTDSLFGIFSGENGKEMALASPANQTPTYDSYDMMNVTRKGKVVCNAETIVKNGDPVYCRFYTTDSKKRGAFRNDSDSGKAFLVTGAVWRITTTATNTLSVIEINLPQ